MNQMGSCIELGVALVEFIHPYLASQTGRLVTTMHKILFQNLSIPTRYPNPQTSRLHMVDF